MATSIAPRTMYSTLRLAFDSRAVLRSIRSYGSKGLLPARQQLSFAVLGTKRLSLAQHNSTLTNKFTKSSFRVGSGSMSGTLLAYKRSFHTTRPRRIFFGDDRRPLKVYRISPMMVFLSGVGFFVLAFAVIPFVFTFFLPLFIGTVVVCQFNKWRRNVMLREVIASLKKSTMYVNFNTVRALHIKSMGNLLKVEQQNVQSFRDMLKQFDVALGSTLDHPSAANADRLLNFINKRLLEAIENDEGGIRSYFLGNDVENWISQNYDLELDTKQYKVNGKMLGKDSLMILTFPLYLKSSSHPRKHLANVSLVVSQNSLLNPSAASNPFLIRSMRDSECQMLLSVRPISLISTRQFILTSAGHSDLDNSNYEVRRTPDNHTEYIIRSND